MDWFTAIVVDPFDDPAGWIAYLALPVLSSAALAWGKPGLSKTAVVAIVVPTALVFYFGAYVALNGMSSTISIGLLFALVIYCAASATSASAARWLRRRL